VHRLVAWLTGAALADSILGDLEEQRLAKGTLWFWLALAGIAGHALRRRTEDALRGSSLRGVPGDVRHAVRVLRRRPAFAICTVLLLALGIGANTAVFSVVRAVLLRPLPYADVDRLAFIWSGSDTYPGNVHGILTGQNAIDIQRHATTLQSVALVKGWQTGLDGQIDLALPGGAERLRGAQVTPNFFELLGARAAIGHAFGSSDDAPLAVISDSLWRRGFNRDASVIGRDMAFAAGRSERHTTRYTIVGVLPPEFRYTYPRETEVYLLLPWRQINYDRGLEYQMIARLKPDVAVGRAQAELTAIAKNVVRTYKNPRGSDLDDVLARTSALVEPVTVHLQAEVRPGILLLAAVAALVLLIACVNLGLLVLARTVDRRGELGLRAALGASPFRIVSQLVAESAVLSVAGGAVGLGTAAMAEPLLRSLMPPVVPRADQIGIDPVVVSFSLGLMAMTAVICGIVPAMFVLRRDLLDSVRRVAGSSTGDRAILAWRRTTVAVQVAFVVLLLVGSGLLLRSFWRLQQVDLGFDAPDVITMEIRLLNPAYRVPGRVAAFERDLLDRLREVPGVTRAGMTTAVPMRGVDFLYIVGPRGGPLKPGNARTVDPAFFDIIHVRLRAGRFLTNADTASSPPVMVVSESYGRSQFGSQNPVGRTLDFGGHDVSIVGVVGDVRYVDTTRDAAPAFYLPQAQNPPELMCLIVEPRSGMTASVIADIRRLVRSMDPDQPVQDVTTIGAIVNSSTADRRFYAVTTGAFASVALVLAIAGIFGAVLRTVTERTRELAIRVALGADPRRLVRLVYGYGLLPAAAGIIAGLSAAGASSRLLKSLLFQIAPTDVVTYAGAAALVIVVAALACYLPARRTLRVQPMAILKTE
jgi:putative ABC transport system permease protein